MSISMCRRISMALVVCICASFCLLPFRAAAGQAEINNLAQPALEQIAKLNNVLVSDDEEAEQILKSLFLVYDTDGVFAQVVLEDLEGVAKILSQNGISAIFKEVPIPSSGYGWVLECDSIASFPVNIFGLYAPGGRIIYTPTEEEDDSAATTSRPSYTAPSASVDVEYTQIFDSTTNTWVDVEINKYDQSVTNNTTNNNHYWDVDNRQFWDVENNTYTTYNDITYNPSTQTYNVQFSDNRSYTYQFYYDYTYITYIGSSAEYREAYKVYYELPDGRSSADLTVDDLKGLSLQFDMVNYGKAASDTLTHALYPFDGDIENDSYYDWSEVWIANASTEYLEASEGFGGSLYLDTQSPTRLNFLSSSFDVSDGFTFQCRLYASAGAGPLVALFRGSAFSPYASSYSSGSAPVSLVSITDSNSYWYNPFSLSGNTLYVTSGSRPASSSSQDYVSSTYTYPVGQWFDFTLVYVPPATGFSNTTFSQYSSSPGKYFMYVNGVLALSSTVVPQSNYDSSDGSTAQYTYRFLNGNNSLAWPDSLTTGRNNYAPLFSTLDSFCFFSPASSTSYNYWLIDNLRIVNTALYNGSDSFTPTPVPFSPNLVYVLPSVSDLNDNTVAIMSQLPVTGYRVGGIRPTDPTLAAGYVWMHIDGEFVDSVQQWNGAYWEEVTARLYTGVRWIPVTAFNVFTLEDMFDIIDPDGDGSGESVSTIYQYYLWWSGEWGTFQQWLQGTMDTLIEAIQNSGSGGSGEVVIVPGYNDQTTTNEITTENPDGSTTVTTIVSNAAGLVYSRSVTTWPPDADGNVTTREVYTDSTGVMYQTTIVTDRDGNVTITEPSEATGTLASILKTITQGVMSIATTVIQAFVDLLVDLVGFVLDSVGRIFSGITNILGTLLSALTSFVAELGTAAQFLPAFFSILPAPIQAGFTLIFVGCVAIGLFRLIHF